jgi:hypothetical protein
LIWLVVALVLRRRRREDADLDGGHPRRRAIGMIDKLAPSVGGVVLRR